MDITLSDVKKMFLEVLSGNLSREAADRWAHSVIQKSEAKELVFCPPEDREKIWAGVMYLYGIDSRQSPDHYLHTVDEIRRAMKEKIGE